VQVQVLIHRHEPPLEFSAVIFYLDDNFRICKRKNLLYGEYYAVNHPVLMWLSSLIKVCMNLREAISSDQNRMMPVEPQAYRMKIGGHLHTNRGFLSQNVSLYNARQENQGVAQGFRPDLLSRVEVLVGSYLRIPGRRPIRQKTSAVTFPRKKTRTIGCCTVMLPSGL